MENCKQFATGIHEKLFTVVTKINKPNLKSVDALLIDLTGDHIAGLMLGKLFYWWSKSKDGWVYKSWRDWDAELRITRNQVGRVHAKGYLEAIGVERVQKLTMKGNPVHYRLNVGKFLQALAKFAGIGIQQVRAWLTGKQDSPKAKSASVETKQANNNNTFQPTEQTIQTDVVADEIPFGVPEKKFKKLLERYGAKRVSEMIAYTAQYATSNPAGFFVRGLEENWGAVAKPVTPTKSKSPYAGMTWGDIAEQADVEPVAIGRAPSWLLATGA